ncbi:GNAT family N-acetyltransferase [Streptacidiphilus jiangxiensis]|uniref:Acetyltransferase (GNAT) family protein n=1 Tax=Streptacidiphilus jiangxiensis TaxID=235985 RepID=A0A1H7LS74_STRJI|nr:GNAT family N-acetyltransferase [Streptacidiphilus jiangxiensis]SEL01803.1 Acetyltransferase (GNAT) family protein [Streptacidiphilus jiangxiensis]
MTKSGSETTAATEAAGAGAGAGTGAGAGAEKLRLRLATAHDVPGVLAVMDGIVEWLVGLGRTAQWGTEPWSASEALVERVEGRIARGELRVAVTRQDEIAGVLSVAETASTYVRPADEPELFINLLATSRRFKGQDVGGLLIAEARSEAARRGLGLLRVDCFAGDDGRLTHWYASQGFTEVEPFVVQREGRPDWPGMLFALRVERAGEA